MSTCARGGYLVDGTHSIPTDPTDLHVEGLPVVGCNRLRCARCGADVRHATGLSLVQADVTGAELGALHATADLAGSPLLRAGDPRSRLYVCRCSRWLETSRHACDELDAAVPSLYDDDPAPAADPAGWWRCQGHAPITLPHDVDGVVVASQEDLRDLALLGFQDGAPPRARAEDKDGAAWLVRLHTRLAPADAAFVTSVALACLLHDAPRTRALALRFLCDRPGDDVRARVLELFEQRRDLFEDVPDDLATHGGATLEHTAWRLLGPLIATPGRARDLARSAFLEGAASRVVEDALRMHDGTWLQGQKEEAKEEARSVDASPPQRTPALHPRRDTQQGAAMEPVRALDDPRLQDAIDIASYGETFARSEEPLGVFLRAVGAFHHELHEETPYTDWNGAVVGGETGPLLRAAIPPSALPFSELAPLLTMGRRARALVAAHPSTPDDVLAKLAEDTDSEVRSWARENQGRRVEARAGAPARASDALEALDRLDARTAQPQRAVPARRAPAADVPARGRPEPPAPARRGPAERCPKCGSGALEPGHTYTCYDCGAEFGASDAIPYEPPPPASPVAQVTGRALACPRCEITLHEERTDDITLYGCGRCGGVWLDEEASRKLVTRLRPDVLELAARADRIRPPKDDGRATTRRCPIDRKPLEREVVRGIELDTCSMHGAFFDVGEVRRLAAAFEHDRQASAAASVQVLGGLYRSMAKPDE